MGVSCRAGCLFRGRPELSSFSRAYVGRDGGQGLLYAFEKCVYDALRFSEGASKSTFSKYSFGMEGGGSQKRNLRVCTLLIMLTILDDPLPEFAL